ncbi:MAG: RNA polymerase sporulation sigma factor SigH [Eubacteriales bacterium]|nr:RNA polymerase sporulation sigma factor SigH [Eubacteriales bacterium]
MNTRIKGGCNLGTSERSSLEEYSIYETMPDETIAELARECDGGALEYLLNKYKNFVRAKARSYFLIGADREDIVQEGMIGLYKAIRDFRSTRLTSFRAFAELCITRQIITAIKTATRQKHRPLNSYVSLNKPVYDEESDRTLIDVIASGKISNPEEIFIGKEDFSTIESKMGKLLSPLEMQVLKKYIEGKSYYEVAHELDRSVKSVDNALQRVKNKLEKLISSENND